MKNNKSICKNAYWSQLIVQLREKKGWTQERLAELLQTDQATISRWECGECEPRSDPVRQILESLAREFHLCFLGDTVNFVRQSPFPMILVDRNDLVVAASASSRFQEGKTCIEQTPMEERACLRTFQKTLFESGFWQMQIPRIEYEFARNDEIRGAVVTRLAFWGEVYALVQKSW